MVKTYTNPLTRLNHAFIILMMALLILAYGWAWVSYEWIRNAYSIIVVLLVCIALTVVLLVSTIKLKKMKEVEYLNHIAKVQK
jgi:phosphatidylserine synthase